MWAPLDTLIFVPQVLAIHTHEAYDFAFKDPQLALEARELTVALGLTIALGYLSRALRALIEAKWRIWDHRRYRAVIILVLMDSTCLRRRVKVEEPRARLALIP